MKLQALPIENNENPMQRLLAIMARLRSKENGCPWDLEQNFATIAPYTLEEAYEVADAIARHDLPALKEELGDLLLQVVFHSQMAREMAAFTFEDVASAICEKMIRRHPHVFGDTKIESASAQTEAWEQYKQQERADKAKSGAMDDIPHAFPALLRAEKIQKRAAKLGFDWPEAAPIFNKIEEEIEEVKEAMATKDASCVEEELGDLFFAVVNLSRHLGVGAEEALRNANRKFESRFRHMESLAAEQQTSFEQMSLDEMEALWTKVKSF